MVRAASGWAGREREGEKNWAMRGAVLRLAPSPPPIALGICALACSAAPFGPNHSLLLGSPPARRDRYTEVAAAHGLTTAQLSLGWCYSRPWVASTIVGATTEAQLRENLGAWALAQPGAPGLPAGALEGIEEVYKRFRDPSKT